MRHGGTWWDTGTDRGTNWLKENGPSPAGWRVPTVAELEALTDAEKVNSEWVVATEAIPAGQIFTDVATGNSIFFRDDGNRQPDDSSILCLHRPIKIDNFI